MTFTKSLDYYSRLFMMLSVIIIAIYRTHIIGLAIYLAKNA